MKVKVLYLTFLMTIFSVYYCSAGCEGWYFNYINSNDTAYAYGGDTIEINLSDTAGRIEVTSTDTWLCPAPTSYEWYLNGNLVYTTTSNIYKPSSPGFYTIKVYYIYNLSSGSVTYNITLLDLGVGIKQVDINPVNFKVYPNPASDIVTINGLLIKNVVIKVLDMAGNLVMEEALRNSQIDLSSLAKGIYLLELKSEGEVISREKIIKQ